MMTTTMIATVRVRNEGKSREGKKRGVEEDRESSTKREGFIAHSEWEKISLG